jgi:hypothetical protein
MMEVESKKSASDSFVEEEGDRVQSKKLVLDLSRMLPSPPYSGRTPPESGEFSGTQIHTEKLYYRNIFPTPFNTKLHRNINGISLYSHQTPPDSGEFGGTQIGRETGIEIFFPRLWRGQYNTRYYFISRKKYTEQELNLQHYKTCTLAN